MATWMMIAAGALGITGFVALIAVACRGSKRHSMNSGSELSWLYGVPHSSSDSAHDPHAGDFGGSDAGAGDGGGADGGGGDGGGGD